MSNFDQLLLYNQLKNYQIQRHDFLNNFQVIRGYLQLGMPDKALQYIDEAVEGMHTQQEIYLINQKTLMAIVLGWLFDLRLKGIQMIVRFPAEMKTEDFWKEHWREEYAQQFYGYTKECVNLIPEDEDPEELLAEVYLSTTEQGYSCQFHLLKEDELYKQQDFQTGQ